MLAAARHGINVCRFCFGHRECHVKALDEFAGISGALTPPASQQSSMRDLLRLSPWKHGVSYKNMSGGGVGIKFESSEAERYRTGHFEPNTPNHPA